MDKYIVYQIKNTVNNKLYFGVTKCSIRKRWIQHKCNSSRKKYHLYRAMIKYGVENFSISLIKECDSEDEMYSIEKELIKKHRTNEKEFGYNNSIGGEASSKGKKLSTEQILKISEFQKKRKRKPFSEETIIKMRQSAKGRDMSKAVYASAMIRRGKPSKNRMAVLSTDKHGAIKKYESITIASKITGISLTSISNNLLGYSKTAGGLTWYYQHKN